VLDVASGDLGETSPRPVLVKIAPDLERNEMFRICETALELGVDGIVACNTSVQREALGVGQLAEAQQRRLERDQRNQP